MDFYRSSPVSRLLDINGDGRSGSGNRDGLRGTVAPVLVVGNDQFDGVRTCCCVLRRGLNTGGVGTIAKTPVVRSDARTGG